MNDIYGNINTKVNMAVKTPVGITKRCLIQNVITQGDVFGPILCSNQIDTFGKECLEGGKYTYTYKGEVEIPPLSMVDDLICISECGHRTAMMNAFINYKTNSKKLQFGVNKCKKLHVGHKLEEFKCQDLNIDKWSEVIIKDDITGEVHIDDVCDGQEVIEEKSEEKYLGDVISTDGKNIKNIKARISKGKGIVNKILTILDGIPFGRHYFEIGMLLRDSLLVSSMLFNAEAWYNLSNSELDLLETIDVSFMRQLLRAPKGTPIEMLYLELGSIPFRHIITERRLGFYHYLLNENSESMVNKFLHAQMKNRTKRDWASRVIEDLKSLGMEKYSMDQIKNMKKGSFSNMVKKQCEKLAFEKLENKKKSHSKVENLEHTQIIIQKYLQPNKTKITRQEAQLIFKLRCRVTEVKNNMQGKYDKLECGACGEETETQQHIMICKEINKNRKSDIKVKYEKLFNGLVIEKVKIARIFQENLEILEKMKKES